MAASGLCSTLPRGTCLHFGSNKGLVLWVGLRPGVNKAEKGNFLFSFSRLLLFITISDLEKKATEPNQKLPVPCQRLIYGSQAKLTKIEWLATYNLTSYERPSTWEKRWIETHQSHLIRALRANNITA